MEIKILKEYKEGMQTLKIGREYLVTYEFGLMLIENGYAESTKGLVRRESRLIADNIRKSDPDIHIHFDSKTEEE